MPVEHLAAPAARAKSAPELGGSDAIRSVFFGEGSFTTLVESRVHGYADGDIDPALDDRTPPRRARARMRPMQADPVHACRAPGLLAGDEIFVTSRPPFV